MRKVKFLTILVCIFCWLVCIKQISAQEITLVLKAGTPIPLKLTEKVSPKTHPSGSTVHFEVARDIKIEGYIVIKAGTPATGTVFISKKRGAVGQAGEISFTVDYTTAVDGSHVPLRGTFAKTGEEKLASTTILSYFICPLFLLRKGGAAEFPPGIEIKAYCDSDVEVKVIPE